MKIFMFMPFTVTKIKEEEIFAVFRAAEGEKCTNIGF
jgi:hypothetical protein